MTCFGVPSQIRVFDSRSYFFMMASTSSAVPVSTSATGDVLTFMLSFSAIPIPPLYFVSGAAPVYPLYKQAPDMSETLLTLRILYVHRRTLLCCCVRRDPSN